MSATLRLRFLLLNAWGPLPLVCESKGTLPIARDRMGVRCDYAGNRPLGHMSLYDTIAKAIEGLDHSQQEYAPVLHLRFLRIIKNAIKLRIPITPAETKRMAGDSTPNGQTHLLCPTSG